MKLIDGPRAVDAAVAKVAQIREAFGTAIDFGIDFHGRVAAPMARVLLRELEPFKPLFVEEPVLPEQGRVLPAAGRVHADPAGRRRAHVLALRFQAGAAGPAACRCCSRTSRTPAASPNA